MFFGKNLLTPLDLFIHVNFSACQMGLEGLATQQKTQNYCSPQLAGLGSFGPINKMETCSKLHIKWGCPLTSLGDLKEIGQEYVEWCSIKFSCTWSREEQFQ